MDFSNINIIWIGELPHLCECGCERVTNEGRKFLSGHNPHPKKEKAIPLLCECGFCNEFAMPGKRFVWGHNVKLLPKEKRGTRKGQHNSEEQNRKIGLANSISLLGNIAWNTGLTKETDERVRKNAESNREPHLGKPGYWKDKQRYPETIKLLSEIAINNWENNPEYVEKYRNGVNAHPNKPETIILNLLNDLYPGEWKYTGDFSFWINGKNPDFVNVNGQKKLIELFGDYWHQDENPQDRIDIFKPYGWKTLVIWEKELKDIEMVKSKISEFSEMNHAG